MGMQGYVLCRIIPYIAAFTVSGPPHGHAPARIFFRYKVSPKVSPV
jgi:hypothetical protein